MNSAVLALAGHVAIPRENDFDFIAEAESVFVPPPPKKKAATKKAKQPTPIECLAKAKTNATDKRATTSKKGIAETRWPTFIAHLLNEGIHGATFVPLSSGSRRLGVLAFGILDSGVQAVYKPSDMELALVQRFASEAAVTVDAYLMQQQLTQQRDRLQVLFDVTNALISKLPWDALFTSISDQLSRIIKHDFALLTLYDENTGRITPHAIHFPGKSLFDNDAPDIGPATSGSCKTWLSALSF